MEIFTAVKTSHLRSHEQLSTVDDTSPFCQTIRNCSITNMKNLQTATTVKPLDINYWNFLLREIDTFLEVTSVERKITNGSPKESVIYFVTDELLWLRLSVSCVTQ